MSKIMIITDNLELLEKFKKLVAKNHYPYFFAYFCSPKSPLTLDTINLKKDYDVIINEGYSLVISLHCNQLFPENLVKQIRCINVHPGFNPFNRGWYPHVFSIINKLKAGVTIHEIDKLLDHGPIIVQKELEIYPYDTSLSCYQRLLELEMELLETYLPDIIDNSYKHAPMLPEGNINYRQDFNRLCELNLNETLSMGDAINRLRALSHGKFKNAYFYDDEGNKIFIRISLSKEDMGND